MSILYCGIASGKKILCEINVGAINLSSTVRCHIDNSLQEYVTFAIARNTYNAYNRNDITYIAIVDASTSQQQTLSFLRQLESKFSSNPSLAMQARNGAEFCLQVEFGRNLSAEVANFNAQDPSRLIELRSQVADISQLMEKNISKVQERGQRLDDLVEKTEDLHSGAQMFQTTARTVKQKAYKENLKMKVICISISVIIGFIILMIILWQTGVFDKKS